MRIVERDTFARIERLLIGKVANGGPKKLAKGTKITKDYLDGVEPHNWFDIRMAEEESRKPSWKACATRSKRRARISMSHSKRRRRS
jgi:hypothetical protein